MSSPYGPDPYRRGSTLSRSFIPLALITLGVVVLLSNFASSMISDRGRGGLIVFGLGAAFAVGRITTSRYGYAVPAGLLMSLGAFIVAQSLDIAQGTSAGGLFFVMFGLGFALVYIIGLRPSAVWPLVPAAMLVGIGGVHLGLASLGPLASWSWIANYWPVALVLLGVWLLFRDSLPVAVRGPIASLGGILLLAYGVIAAAATLAAAGNFPATGAESSPFADTLTLPDVPIANGQTFTVNNTSGTTTIRPSGEQTVHVVATRHFAFGGQAPDVKLTPSGSGVTLGSSATNRGRFPFLAGSDSGSVDYTIDLPPSAAIVSQSTSGKVVIDGVNGSVTASANSGGVDLSDIGGAVQVQTTSGAINLRNISGEVRATATSGSIRGSDLQHVRQVQTSNGSISLQGVFTDAASIAASSGPVNLTLMPGSAVSLDAHTSSGRVEPRNLLNLRGGVTRRDALSGAVGSPAPDATLHVQTSSGSITISSPEGTQSGG
jgi:putative adhesin